MEKKEVYFERVKIMIDEQISKLERLKAKLQDSKGKYSETKSKIDDFTHSTEDSFDNLKERFEELGIDIYNSFKKFFSNGSSKKR
jgi:hypothetical protein